MGILFWLGVMGTESGVHAWLSMFQEGKGLGEYLNGLVLYFPAVCLSCGTPLKYGISKLNEAYGDGAK